MTILKLVASSTVLVVSILVSVTAVAAELHVDPSGSRSAAVFEGKIEAGDSDKFKDFILKSGRLTDIYLASSGGNLAEAMKIGMLVRFLKLSTVVPSKQLTNQGRDLAAARHDLKDSKDYTCASACFFIFVAGIHRSSNDRGPAILGIHSPTLSPNDLTKMAPNQATVAKDRIRTIIESYLKVMDVPAKYIEEIYSAPDSRVRWIRNDEFQSDFAGFISELKALVKAKCDTRPSRAEQSHQTPKINVQAEQDCETRIRGDLAFSAFKEAAKGRNDENSQSIFNRVPQGAPN
jgi:hypothetical protein